MANNSDQGKYWPWFILGFIAIGVTLGAWTVRSAISLPVHESNAYMMKYQEADIHINTLIKEQEAFAAQYTLEIPGLVPSDFKPKHLKRKPETVYQLTPHQQMTVVIKDRQGKPVDDMNITMQITRPFTRAEDQMQQVPSWGEGRYSVTLPSLKKPGRYTIRYRAQKGDAVAFRSIAGFYKP